MHAIKAKEIAFMILAAALIGALTWADPLQAGGGNYGYDYSAASFRYFDNAWFAK
jgi:hypothetical protein